MTWYCIRCKKVPLSHPWREMCHKCIAEKQEERDNLIKKGKLK